VFVSTLIANIILDVWPSCNQEDTSSILNFLINVFSFFFLVIDRLILLLRSKFGYSFSLLKLIHHISTVILRWLRLDLLLQYFYLLFKPLDFKLQGIILFTYSFITRFYNNLLKILLLTFNIKSININVITSFTAIASRGFSSFGYV
jgi:hypothetical protein